MSDDIEAFWKEIQGVWKVVKGSDRAVLITDDENPFTTKLTLSQAVDLVVLITKILTTKSVVTVRFTAVDGKWILQVDGFDGKLEAPTKEKAISDFLSSVLEQVRTKISDLQARQEKLHDEEEGLSLALINAMRLCMTMDGES